MSDTTFWKKNMIEIKRWEKCEHNRQRFYDCSDEDEKYIKDLVRRMYDAGLNFAEIKYELDKIIGIVLYELEIDLQL